MNDTPIRIRRKQRDIIMSKTPEERFEMGIQMMEDSRELVEQGLKMTNPSISPIELKIEVFKCYYEREFSTIQLKGVFRKMKG